MNGGPVSAVLVLGGRPVLLEMIHLYEHRDALRVTMLDAGTEAVVDPARQSQLVYLPDGPRAVVILNAQGQQ